jgi:Domain of unknown function (DUF1707)/Inner membrane component of T3SS, cytoplasmic domain
MGGSTADTPTTPEFLRVSDADRDQAVNELRSEFVDGRLSHETFVYRMQTALDARNRGQLAGLFSDLPPRRARLLARIKMALRGESRSTPDPRTPPGQAISGSQAVGWGPGSAAIDVPPAGWGNPDGGYLQAPWHHRSGEVSGSGPGRRSAPVNGSGGPGAAPVPFFFPPGGGDRFTIGRTRDCDLCLTDLSVSRLHAELVRGRDGWLLNDLGSHNGTRLNGWLVRETVSVRAGDRLEFGSAAFVVQEDPHKPAAAGSSG